ncbi:sensor histidine kinase, partial [Clostridium perfringens]
NMFVSSRIANPIKSLEKSVKQFENGIANLNISESGSYEIQHLGKAIRSMVNEMIILMENVMKEQEEKRKSELNALQAQINPHFLYNTLDSIIWMIENENYDGAIVMVTALARFFRISLSKGKNVITVRDELEHARNYLTIQNI